ncbi:hypothetical protein RIF29_27387 [Crotalaria pallida]|uniref:Uncharacterized protein n=1 Tax=Crotalaria pallida TaxID=3830 RepID=A0AAN9HYQ1_CROPI
MIAIMAALATNQPLFPTMSPIVWKLAERLGTSGPKARVPVRQQFLGRIHTVESKTRTVRESEFIRRIKEVHFILENQEVLRTSAYIYKDGGGVKSAPCIIPSQLKKQIADERIKVRELTSLDRDQSTC